MQNYKMSFICVQGDFYIEIDTNYSFQANSDEEAGLIAGKMEGKILSFLKPYFKNSLESVIIELIPNDYFNEAYISEFIYFDNPEKYPKNFLNGSPILNHMAIEKFIKYLDGKSFIELFSSQYKDYFSKNKVDIIPFWAISYGVLICNE